MGTRLLCNAAALLDMAHPECIAGSFRPGAGTVTLPGGGYDLDTMRRFTQSRYLYILVAGVFGAVSFQLVEYMYDSELDRVGIIDLPDDPYNLLKQALTVHDISLVIWVLLCGVAGLAVYQVTERLRQALATSQRRAGELALIGTLSAGLSGPLGPQTSRRSSRSSRR
jgi:hypothetical protein